MNRTISVCASFDRVFSAGRLSCSVALFLGIGTWLGCAKSNVPSPSPLTSVSPAVVAPSAPSGSVVNDAVPGQT